MTNPFKKRWQRNNQYPRDGETWDQFYARTAQGMEAPEGGETGTGSTVGDSPVRQDAPNSNPNPTETNDEG